MKDQARGRAPGAAADAASGASGRPRAALFVAPPSSEFVLTPAGWAVGGLVLAVSLAIYSATLAPGLTAGDSGELATAAALGGLAHPPGYPLWTATAHGWVRLLAVIGVEEPVTATNVFSALLTALATGAAAVVLRRLTGSMRAAVAASMMLAVSGPIWSAAVVTEVYALSLLLLVLLAGVMLWGPPVAARTCRLIASGALVGMGLAGHQLFVLIVPLILPWFWRALRPRPARRAGWTALGLTLGLSPLLLLPFQAEATSVLRWGWSGGLDGLWRFLGRGVYEPITAGDPLAQLPARCWLLLRELAQAVSPAPLLLAPLGWWLIWRTGGANCGGRPCRGLAVAASALVAIWLLVLPLVVPFLPTAVGAAGMQPFLYPAVAALAVGWAGLFAVAVRWARRRGRHTTALVSLVACLLPILLAWTRWPYHDRRSDEAALLYAEDLLRCVPESSTLVVEGDNEAFPLLYMQAIHGHRPDVTVRHRRGVVFAAGPDLYRVPPRDREAAVHEVEMRYLCGQATDVAGWTGVAYATYVDLPPEAGVELRPHGLVYLACRANLPPPAVGPAAQPRDPLGWLALRPDGRGARYLDHPTRRLLLAYPATAARSAALTGDARSEAAALHALACLGHDLPGIQRWVSERSAQLQLPVASPPGSYEPTN